MLATHCNLELLTFPLHSFVIHMVSLFHVAHVNNGCISSEHLVGQNFHDYAEVKINV